MVVSGHSAHNRCRADLCLLLPGGEGEKTRKRMASEVLHEALEALREDIDIAIYDSSNVTSQRRKWLADAVASSGLHAQVPLLPYLWPLSSVSSAVCSRDCIRLAEETLAVRSELARADSVARSWPHGGLCRSRAPCVSFSSFVCFGVLEMAWYRSGEEARRAFSKPAPPVRCSCAWPHGRLCSSRLSARMRN